MLSIGLISLLIAVPLFSYRITPSLFNRITSVILIYSALLAFNGNYIESLASGVGIYSGLFHVTSLSLGAESFLLFVGALIILGWAPVFGTAPKGSSQPTLPRGAHSIERRAFGHYSEGATPKTFVPSIGEYSLMILFTTIGASLLISSSDMVSMYLSIELQSFAVYILATLYRDSESSTAAGLKYFLLGGLSSALILLGTALIYSYTGLTQFESIYTLTAVRSISGGSEEGVGAIRDLSTASLPVVLGLVLIGVGFLFKVAAAPFHNWAPDVYDGVPTIVTSWLTTMPKISIFVFLLELQTGLEGSVESLSVISSWLSVESGDTINVWKNLLLVTSLLSLVVGTVVGLSQYRIKRLLAFSTISHVGFLLLALAINTQESIESFLFYIIQYSLTNVNTFLILLAFAYITVASVRATSVPGPLRIKLRNRKGFTNGDIQFIDDLKGQFKLNPLLGISLALCLFSMAGIPPLIGFFAKQMVLYSSTHGGYYFLSLVAILVSVISASYYLKIIRVIYFESPTDSSDSSNGSSANADSSVQTGPSLLSSVDRGASEAQPRSRAGITNMHSMLIATLTMVITLFILQPSILLNSCHLLALTLFYY